MTETIIVVAVVIGLIAVGANRLGQSTNRALDCQGTLIQNPDGTTTCGAGDGAQKPAAGGPIAAAAGPRACKGEYCMCFVAGTPVLTVAGWRPIETIQPGTLVWSRHEEGSDVGWKPVAQTFLSRARALVQLTVQDPAGDREILLTTGNHPFHVEGQGWVNAATLTPGQDVLTGLSSRGLTVAAAESLPGQVAVYNLEVADYHTYFVGHLGVWVHNSPVRAPTHSASTAAARGPSAGGLLKINGPKSRPASPTRAGPRRSAAALRRSAPAPAGGNQTQAPPIAGPSRPAPAPASQSGGLADRWRRTVGPVMAGLRLRGGNTLGQVIPIKLVGPDGTVEHQGSGQIIRINADGSLEVQGVANGVPFQGRGDGRGQVHRYPAIGSRMDVSLPDGTTGSALVISRNDDGSSEVEGTSDGHRWSGRIPPIGNVPIITPPPVPAQPYRPGDPIMGVVPQQVVLPDGRRVTSVDWILIVHPSGPPDPDPHVEAGRATFVPDALDDLNTIVQTESGRRLWDALQNHGGPGASFTTLWFTGGYDRTWDGSDGARTRPLAGSQDSNWDPARRLPGRGAAPMVYYNPSLDGLAMRLPGDPELAEVDAELLADLQQEWGRAVNHPGDLVLFHELVHAADMRQGIDVGAETFGGSSIGVYEEHAVGLGDFSSPLIFSENSYRAERGLVPRPYYGDSEDAFSTEAGRGFAAEWYLSSHTNQPGAPAWVPPPGPPGSSAAQSSALAATTGGGANPFATPPGSPTGGGVDPFATPPGSPTGSGVDPFATPPGSPTGSGVDPFTTPPPSPRGSPGPASRSASPSPGPSSESLLAPDVFVPESQPTTTYRTPGCG